MTPQAQPTCTFNHARPRGIIASLTLHTAQARSLQGIRSRRNPTTKFAASTTGGWWFVAEAESRLTTRIPSPTNRHGLLSLPYSSSLNRLCSYTSGIRRAGKLRLLLSGEPETRLRSAFGTPAPTAADYIHDPVCCCKDTTNPAPPANRQRNHPRHTFFPSVKCKSKLSAISATWRLSDAVA